MTSTLAATQPYEDFVAAFMALLPTEPVKTEAELQAEHDQTMVDRGIVAAESLAFHRANSWPVEQTDEMQEQLQRDHPPPAPFVEVRWHGDDVVSVRYMAHAAKPRNVRGAPRAREASPSRRAASRRTSRGSPAGDPAEPEPPLGGSPLCLECGDPVIPTGRVRKQRSNAETCGARCRKRRERRLKRARGQNVAAWTDPLEEEAAFLREEALVADVERGQVSPWDAILRTVLPPPDLREASLQLALRSVAA